MRGFATFVATLGLMLGVLLGGCSPQPGPVPPPATGVAPDAPATATVEAAAPAPHPVFMWRTESPSAVVHLLGSIHVGSEDMYPLDPRIDDAFEQADALVLEIDLDEEAEADAAAALIELALLPKGQNLDDLLEDETRKLLHRRLTELSIPIDNMQMFRPWFVALTLTMRQLEEQGYVGDFGIDRHFRERAVGKKEILELESVEEQVALFGSLTEDAETEDLRMALEDDTGEQLDAWTDEWLRGESALIEQEIEETRREFPAVYETLYAGRNRKMTEKILGYLETDRSYFVVAGSAHMVGDEGIVELLRQRGHRVVQQ